MGGGIPPRLERSRWRLPPRLLGEQRMPQVACGKLVIHSSGQKAGRFSAHCGPLKSKSLRRNSKKHLCGLGCYKALFCQNRASLTIGTNLQEASRQLYELALLRLGRRPNTTRHADESKVRKQPTGFGRRPMGHIMLRSRTETPGS